MKGFKDAFLYLDHFDENNMFDLTQHNNKLFLMMDILRSEIDRRSMKYILSYCEDGILNVIEFVVKINDLFVLEKLGILKENRKLSRVLSILYKKDFVFEISDERNSDEVTEDSDVDLSKDVWSGQSIGFRNM